MFKIQLALIQEVPFVVGVAYRGCKFNPHRKPSVNVAECERTTPSCEMQLPLNIG